MDWLRYCVCLFFAFYFHLSRIHPDHRHCLVYYCNKLYKCPIYLPIKAEREERGKQIKGNKSNYDYLQETKKEDTKRKYDDRENREEEKEKYERFVLYFPEEKKYGGLLVRHKNGE